MDFSDYRPTPHVLGRIRDIGFVGVIGPTAVGKTTLIKAVVQRRPDLHMLVADVSRLPRPGEQDGVDFNFRPKADMIARGRKGEYITLVTGVTGDLYATAPEQYPVSRTVLMALVAHGVPMFSAVPYRTFRTIFILPPDYATWQQRLERHGFDADQLYKRLREADQSLQFAAKDPQVQFVINNDLGAATEDFIALALDERQDERQLTSQRRGRLLAGQLLDELRQTFVKTTPRRS